MTLQFLRLLERGSRAVHCPLGKSGDLGLDSLTCLGVRWSLGPLHPHLSRHVALFQTSPLMAQAEAKVPRDRQPPHSGAARSGLARRKDRSQAASDPHGENLARVRPLVLTGGHSLTREEVPSLSTSPRQPRSLQGLQAPPASPQRVSRRQQAAASKTATHPPTHSTSSEGPQASTSSECSAAPSPGQGGWPGRA